MPTMSHNKKQRKLWHKGKKRKDETRHAWFKRVVAKDRNFKGAKQIKGVAYDPLLKGQKKGRL